MSRVRKLIANFAKQRKLLVLELIYQPQGKARIDACGERAKRRVALHKKALRDFAFAEKGLQRFKKLLIEKCCRHQRESAISLALQLAEKLGKVLQRVGFHGESIGITLAVSGPQRRTQL